MALRAVIHSARWRDRDGDLDGGDGQGDGSEIENGIAMATQQIVLVVVWL